MGSRGNLPDHRVHDGGLKFISRTGQRVNQAVHSLLLAIEDYRIVRDFRNQAGVEAKVRWLGQPRGVFMAEAPGLPSSLLFNTEQEAVAFYEDALAHHECGEYVTTEEGKTYFLETFNDSPHAGLYIPLDSARVERLREIEDACSAPSSPHYGSW